MTEEQKKEFTLRVKDLFDQMDNLTAEDLDSVKSASQQVVGLRDSSKFNLSLEMLSREDIKDNRRALVSAVTADNYKAGFMMAIKLLALFGAI